MTSLDLIIQSSGRHDFATIKFVDIFLPKGNFHRKSLKDRLYLETVDHSVLTS